MASKGVGRNYVAKSCEEKFKALQAIDGGEKKSAVGKRLGVPANTVSTWLKNRKKIEAAVSRNEVGSTRKRKRESVFADVDESLWSWFKQARSHGINLNGPLLQEKARDFFERLKADNFQASDG